MTAPESDHDRLWSSWVERVDRLYPEVRDATHHRDIWTQVRNALVERENEVDWTFFRSWTPCYVAWQMMFVRRMTDKSDGSKNSLVALIDQIIANRDVATIERHLLAGPTDVDAYLIERARHAFLNRWGAEDKVTTEALTTVRVELVSVTLPVAVYATRRFAHLDSRQFVDEEVVTFEKLHSCVDTVVGVYNDLRCLLKNSTVWLPPTIQTDWKAPLRGGVFPPLEITARPPSD